ncbi:MAG: FKBP-type peptidyl-prolyl cis-trans isomerase, partial [Saprospiraceae bacterium]
ADGKMFDSSFGRGEPIEFPLGVGQVIPGWDEGLSLLKQGGKATLFIPYQLAYGDAGSPPVIPPKAELIFYVEVVKAQ